MSKVIRLSDDILEELNFFWRDYENILEEFPNDPLLQAFYFEHYYFNDSEKVAFAIRYACCKLRQDYFQYLEGNKKCLFQND